MGVFDRIYQVMVGEVSNVTGLNAQIPESLGLRVDVLVQELTLYLIGSDGSEIEELVEQLGDGFQDSLGDVDVAALLVDFLVNHLGDLTHAVLLGAVELEGLSGG